MRDGSNFPARAVATSIRMTRRWREGGFGLLSGALTINNCCVFLCMVIFGNGYKGKKRVFCMRPLVAQIHNAERIKQNTMLKCLYFFSCSSHACNIFFPEAGLNVTLLIHTCHFELLCGLCRCGFIPNPLVSPPM